MKKLATIFLAVAFTGGVALACPHEEATTNENTPKTAEKDKAKEADKAKAEKAKEADKAKTAKPAEKPTKPADKVSQK